MAARSLGLAATLGLAANAFLLPPSVSTDDIKADLDLSTWELINPSSQSLLVPCSGCETDKSGPINLLLNISTGSQPGTLELGGKPFYPPSAFMLSGGALSEPSALAVPGSDSMGYALAQPEDEYIPMSISGWSFSVHEAETVSEHGEELLELKLLIKTVNREPVYVPEVEIRVLKDPKVDSLTLLSAEWLDPETTGQDTPTKPEIGIKDDPECETALCQWRQFIGDKIHGISEAAHNKFGSGRPCPGKMMGMLKGGMMKDGMPHGPPSTNMHHGPNSHHHRPIGDFGRPHHHMGPGHHHGHHKLHQIMHRVGSFIMAVAIPILIGIAAGVFTYAVGMVIGCAIALIWIKVFRGGKRGYASVAQAEDEAVAKEAEAQAEPRASYESAPPVYEDAPAYEEKQVV